MTILNPVCTTSVGNDTGTTCSKLSGTNTFKIKNLKAGDNSAFVNIGEILNPSMTVSLGSLIIQGYDENNYLMDQGTFANFGDFYNLIPSPFTSVSLTWSQVEISKSVNLTVNFTTFNTLPSGSKIQVFISSES